MIAPRPFGALVKFPRCAFAPTLVLAVLLLFHWSQQLCRSSDPTLRGLLEGNVGGKVRSILLRYPYSIPRPTHTVHFSTDLPGEVEEEISELAERANDLVANFLTRDADGAQ